MLGKLAVFVIESCIRTARLGWKTSSARFSTQEKHQLRLTATATQPTAIQSVAKVARGDLLNVRFVRERPPARMVSGSARSAQRLCSSHAK